MERTCPDCQETISDPDIDECLNCGHVFYDWLEYD